MIYLQLQAQQTWNIEGVAASAHFLKERHKKFCLQFATSNARDTGNMWVRRSFGQKRPESTSVACIQNTVCDGQITLEFVIQTQLSQ